MTAAAPQARATTASTTWFMVGHMLSTGVRGRLGFVLQPAEGRRATSGRSLANPQLDGGRTEVELFAQHSFEVPEIRSGQLAVGEQRERGRVDGSLGGVEHAGAMGRGLSG